MYTRIGRNLAQFTLLTCVSHVLAGEAKPVDPALPRTSVNPVRPAVTGNQLPVHSGEDLQAAYSRARCGDALVLDAGATFKGNFTFNKQCNPRNWIQVVSANLADIPITRYATPLQANHQNSAPAPPDTGKYAKLISGNGGGVVSCTDTHNVPGKYNYFGGLEITNTQGTGLIVCTNGLAENLVSQLPDHITFDRLYVHGITASSTQQFLRAFLLTGSHIAVVNSYTQDIYSTYADSQAILIALGPGPYLIHNNYLEASGENLMSGGTGRTPGYSCGIAASPAPTTTTASVDSCTDAAGNAVSPPAAGTCAMFYVGGTYNPDNWVCVTANSNGAITWSPPLSNPPDTGAGRVKWGIVPADITVTNNVFYKPTSWNPASTNYDGVSVWTCNVASSPAPTTTSATLNGCSDANGKAGTYPGPGATAIFYIGGATVQVKLMTVDSGSGAVTFAAQSAAPAAGARQCLLGSFRSVKNFLEAKYGVRWLVNGNIMQHVWNGGQGGAVNLNASDQNGDCPWCVTSDITLTNNIFQDLYGGIAIIPAQSYSGPAPGPLARVLIKNNLFWPQYGGQLMVWAGYIGKGLPIPGLRNGVDSLQLIHNHILGPGQNIHVGGTIERSVPQNYTNLVVKDNLTEFDQYRWANQCVWPAGKPIPDGIACIESTLNTERKYTISNNAVINTGAVNGGQGVSDSTLRTRYGSLILNKIVDTYSAAKFVNWAEINSDYHNYGLAPDSPFHGLASDGTDPGANLAAIDAALGATPKVRAALNGASLQASPITPGEVVTIEGDLLGPEAGAAFSVDPANPAVDSSLAGTQLLFDGYAAPILYASSTQINGVVPYEIAGQSQTALQVVYQGAPSESTWLDVSNATPGVFTTDASGSGQAVAANQDGSFNGAASPASAGSIVTVYFTGGGQTNPAGVTGSINGSDLKWLTQEVFVEVAGKRATVAFAGAAPTLLDGVQQLNLQLALDTPAGPAQPIVITVGSASSPASATLAVQ